MIPEEARNIFNQGLGTDEVVRQRVLNFDGRPVSSRSARRWRQEWKEEFTNAAGVHETDEEVVINLDTSEVKTIDQLVAECQIDLEYWEIEKCEVTKHEVPRKDTEKHLTFDDGKITGHVNDSGKMFVQIMYNIRIVLKRRKIQPFESAMETLITNIREQAPDFKHAYTPIEGEYLFSPQMYDAHFNKRGMDSSYTLQQAAQDYKAVGDALIAKVLSFKLPIDRIMLPVGNDALHADNLIGTTSKGTWVELAGDQRDAIEAMCDAHVYVIDGLSQIAPVDVVVVPGNHDRYTTYWLGMFLQGWFHKYPNVKVDTDKSPRKYYAYGNVLIGLEHGDKVRAQDLVALMAYEAPQMWADSTYRVWMRGHLHGKAAMYNPITENYGVTVMTIPALCDEDEYHVLHGFVGNHRAAEGMLFHKKHGLDTVFPVYVDEISDALSS